MYKGCPTFLTLAYRQGHIHFKTVGNDTEITAQYPTPDGGFVLKPARSERGAKCIITRARGTAQ